MKPEASVTHVAPTERDQAEWFALAVQPHEPALRAYLRHQFPTLDADDLVQESYIKLLGARRAGPIASAKAYLFSIARNAALAVFRRRHSRREVSVNDLDDSVILESDSNVVESVNARLEMALVVEAIDRLPGRCREIISLRALHGLSHHEIAAKLGLSENTVRVQVARGMKKCAEFLHERGVRWDAGR